MGENELGETDRADQKNNKIFCSAVQIFFVIVVACLLAAAVGIMVYYLPSYDTPTAAPVSGLMEGRLPTTVLPRRYEVNLRPFLYEEDVAFSKMGERFTFDGRVQITVECMEPTDEITMHCKYITIHGMPTVRLAGRSTGEDIFQSYQMVEEYAFLILKLKEKMILHEEYDIFIDYSGIITDDLAGFYRSMYVDSLNNTRYIATTQMEGPYARRVWPCFDEPEFKASYDVQLEHRRDMSALANGIATDYVNLDDYWGRTYYKRVPSLSTYLLAFIVHDFSSINVTNANGCLIRVWAETDLINLAPYALNISDKVQTFFDEYFDNEYPLDKQDHIAIQELPLAAMENWGLITYYDENLLYGMDDRTDIRAYSETITHELAHQWFGNLVTMEWWNDLWLNEGFATYMEHIGVNFVHPEFNMFETFYEDISNDAMYFDSLGVYPSLRAPVYATDQAISETFSYITYFKGGSILLMMEHFLTTEIFNLGIRNYLKERSYKNANAEHLWTELTKADNGNHDVKKIMDTWTLQPGHPLVTLTRTGNTIEATQELFLQLDAEPIDEAFGNLGYQWYIPLTYVYLSGPTDQYDNPEQVWMTPDIGTTEFQLPASASSDWYLANAKMVGYYRTNYDDENWQRLLDQAATEPNVFSEENKAGLVYDSLELATAEVIPFYIYQNFSSYLASSSDLSRKVVVASSSYYCKMLANTYSDQRQSSSPIKAYMQQLVEPLYEQFGWDTSFVPVITNSRAKVRTESRVDVTSLACRYGYNDCVTKASTLFQEYLDNVNDNTIPVNLRSAVYCNGIRYGGQTEWEFGWNTMRTTTNRWERSRWLSALACSTNGDFLKDYLQCILDSSYFNRHEIQIALMGVSENPAGYEVAWDFLRNNFGQLHQMYKGKGEFLSTLLQEITSYFNTDKQLQQILDFGQGRSLGPLKYAYQTAVISTKVNINWMAKSAEQTQQWLALVTS